MQKDVLLVYPGKKGSYPVIPLGLLYLSWALIKKGYNPQILDMRIQDYADFKIDNFICVGISTMSGFPIKYALEFAKFVKSKNPNIPIIWGGVHPTLLPEQTVSNEYVDVVVRGEGELTFVELVDRYNKNQSIKDVKGITYRYNGDIINNPDREYIDLNTIDVELPYHLLDLDKYPMFKDEKNLQIHTSRGCPFRCRFCYNLKFNKRSYRYKTSEKVLDEIEYIINKFDITNLTFIEDNFFTNIKRVEEICNGLLKRNLKIKWRAMCRFDTFAKFVQSFCKLLENSGCDMISFGGESGSNRMLNFIQKDITISTILKATENISKTNIKQVTSFMSGLPTETTDDINQTINLIDKIIEINPKGEVNAIFMYTPYPGTPLFDIVVERCGFVPPRTLTDWSMYKIYMNAGANWYNFEHENLLRTLSILTRFPFYTDKYEIPKPYNKYKIIYKLYSYSARKRWKNRFFKYPVEWRLLEKLMLWHRDYV